jgi:hypothetical protein
MYKKFILILFLFSSLVMVGFRLGDVAQSGQPPVLADHADNFAVVFPEINQESREWYSGQADTLLYTADMVSVKDVSLLEFPLVVPPSQVIPAVRSGFFRLARDSVAS